MGLKAVAYNLRGAGVHAQAPNHLNVTANMASATWNTVASHEVFTVTGAVRMQIWILCTGTLTDAADGASIQFGIEGATNAFIATTGAAGAGAVTISAGEIWCDATPTETYTTAALAFIDRVILGGLDVGYEITGAALTGGALDFHCVWVPLDATGQVVAGAGGTL